VNTNKIAIQEKFQVPLLFIFSRLILLLSLPLDGIKSYGDFWNFTNLANLGRPFLDIWVEFPPVFPYLSRGIYLLAGGAEHVNIYLTAILFSLVQATNIYLFNQIANQIWDDRQGNLRVMTYGFMIVGLFYGWAYFDCLAVFLMLLGLDLLIRSKNLTSGLALGLGGLVKWFPVLLLPAAWKWLGMKKAIKAVLAAILVIVLAWGVLYSISPSMTIASLKSQGTKGSWESIWALIDGNLGTGNFNQAVDRSDPTTVSLAAGNPAKISPWLTLVAFGGLGLYLFWKAKLDSEKKLIAFIGLTLIIFFLWSPGYSPQWVLYLLPLVMLSLPANRHILSGLLILMINLLEWPVLLSRGLFQFLPGLVILRSVIYILIGFMFYMVVFNKDNARGEV
jgi:hypothetical protein